MKIACLAAATMLMLPSVALAQHEVSPPSTPPVTSANGGVAAQAAARQDAIGATNAQVQAQDMAAYDRALRQHHRAVNRDQRVYRRQQRAYADAMAVWRQQVRDCKHGNNRACRAPTPDPAAFF